MEDVVPVVIKEKKKLPVENGKIKSTVFIGGKEIRMSELTPEKAREIIKDRIPGPPSKVMDRIAFGAEKYLERDTQLRPLIEGLVGSLERVRCEQICKLGHIGRSSEEHCLSCFSVKRIDEALTLAHKAGFGKKEK